MYIAVAAIALVALVGLVLLVRFISKGDGRIALWAVFLALATIIASLLVQIASIYYRIPVGWLVVVAVSVLVVGTLFWLVGRSVGWHAPRVVAVVALVLLSLVTLTFVMIAIPFGGVFLPLFEIRAQQIAEVNGFDVALPADAEMNIDAGMPVSATADDKGVAVSYKRFNLVERKADGELGYAELEQLMAPGEYPVGDIGPGSAIPEDAEYTELEVDGQPALGVSYRAVTEEKADELTGTDGINVLVLDRDGVVVTLYSQGYMEYQPDGSYTPRAPLSFEELAGIAESLAPVD